MQCRWRDTEEHRFARGPHHCPACLAPDRRAAPQGTHTGTLTLAVTDTAAIVQLGGTVDATASRLLAVVQRAAVARPTVIADLSGAGTCDAAGVAALVHACNTVLHRGGELLLAARPGHCTRGSACCACGQRSVCSGACSTPSP